jgi:hypothetical protein
MKKIFQSLNSNVSDIDSDKENNYIWIISQYGTKKQIYLMQFSRVMRNNHRDNQHGNQQKFQ